MTPEELVDYYKKLLIIQYRSKPRASETIKATTELFIANKIALDVQNAYNIDTAVGVQLDVLGKYAGVSRVARDFTGQITLDDDDFRTLIRVAIIKNTFGSSLYEIKKLFNEFFQGTILAFDFQNMQMGYFFDAAIGSVSLAEVMVRNGYLPKPMGVQLASLIYAYDIGNFFGYISYEQTNPINRASYNTYEDYDMTSPFLVYENAIAL